MPGTRRFSTLLLIFLTVASFGGAWQDAQRRAMFEPFAASSGVKVVDVEYDGAYEEILLADGVPAEELYPLDLDRAFRSLAAIEGEVVFFDDWAAPAELLAAGEAAFAVGTNGRLAGARDAGDSLDLSWNGGIVSSDYFVIPAGTENPEQAQELVRYAVGDEAQAAFPRLIDYGPVNPRAFEALPPNVRLRLPSHPDHAAESVRFDAGWWLEHEDEAHRRYEEWMERVR